MVGIYKTGATCLVVMLHEVSRYGNDEGNKITALLYVQHRLIEGSAMSVNGTCRDATQGGTQLVQCACYIYTCVAVHLHE